MLSSESGRCARAVALELEPAAGRGNSLPEGNDESALVRHSASAFDHGRTALITFVLSNDKSGTSLSVKITLVRNIH
jgi:hypothetical protein